MLGGNPITRVDRDGRFFFMLAFGPSLATGIGDLAAMSAAGRMRQSRNPPYEESWMAITPGDG